MYAHRSEFDPICEAHPGTISLEELKTGLNSRPRPVDVVLHVWKGIPYIESSISCMASSLRYRAPRTEAKDFNRHLPLNSIASNLHRNSEEDTLDK